MHLLWSYDSCFVHPCFVYDLTRIFNFDFSKTVTPMAIFSKVQLSSSQLADTKIEHFPFQLTPEATCFEV